MYSINRLLKPKLSHAIERGKGVLLLGPRQTGKTTLVEQLNCDLNISLVEPTSRLSYEKNPDLLQQQVDALTRQRSEKGKLPVIAIDEIQKVPRLMDTIQYLMDKKKALFVLTGSSARKLRKNPDVNLLPGRVAALRLDPLLLAEFPNRTLDDCLLFGSLPSIALSQNIADRDDDLRSYVTTYLEEEVRAEAIVRNLGSFARFLELAASEAGNILNFRKLSQEIGVSYPTIRSYFEILEDCLIIEMVEPLTRSKTRKKLTRTPKFLFFDLGIRRIAAEEGTPLPREKMGHLFEQFVGLELIRMARLHPKSPRIRFWRDADGPEVDWVIEMEGRLTPIEVKLTDAPKPRDIRHLEIFLDEYPESKEGVVLCQTKHRLRLTERIIGLPWEELPSLLNSSI